MKTTTLSAIALSALFTLGLTNAFAGDVVGGDNWVEFNNIASTKTRAEVIAELKEARAQGLIGTNIETTYPKLPALASTRSRDEVRAEALAANKKPERSVEYSSGR